MSNSQNKSGDIPVIKRTAGSHALFGSKCYCPDCHEWFYNVYWHLATEHDIRVNEPLYWKDGNKVSVV